jgi:hypothetical protein
MTSSAPEGYVLIVQFLNIVVSSPAEIQLFTKTFLDVQIYQNSYYLPLFFTQTRILSRRFVLASNRGIHGLRRSGELLMLHALLSTHLECSLFWKVKAYQFLFNSTSSGRYPSSSFQEESIQSQMGRSCRPSQGIHSQIVHSPTEPN